MPPLRFSEGSDLQAQGISNIMIARDHCITFAHRDGRVGLLGNNLLIL